MRKNKIKYKLKYFKPYKSNVKIKKIIILSIVFIIVFIFFFYFIKLFVNSEFSFKYKRLDEKKVFKNLKVLYYSGNYDELEYVIDNYLKNKLIKSKNGIHDLLIIKLYLLILKNNYYSISDILIKYKKYFPEEEFVFYNAFIIFKQNKISSALRYLNNEIKKQKKYQSVWKKNYLLLSYLYYLNNNIDKSIEILKKINQKDTEVLYNLAFLYMLNNQNNEAVKTLYKIDHSNNLDLNIKINLLTSKLLFLLGNYRESNIYLDKIKDIGIDFDTYYYNYLLNSFYMGNGKSIRKFYNLIKNNKFFYKFYSLLFISSYSIGDYSNAKSLYDKYLSLEINKKIKNDKLNYQDLINYLAYINILIDLNLKDIAIDYIEKILGLNFDESNTLKIYRIYIHLLMLNKNYKKAENIILKNKKFLFIDEFFINKLVDIYINTKNYEKGIEFIRNYYNPEKNPFEYFYLQAYLYRQIKNYSGSTKILFNLLSIITDINKKDLIYKMVVKNDISTKKYKEALNNLKLISNKDDIEFLYLSLKTYFYLQKWDDLIITGKRILLTEKNKQLIYFYIGYGYYKRKDYKQAIFYFKNSIENLNDKKFKSLVSIYIGNSYAYLDDIDNANFYYNESKNYDISNLYSDINIEILNQGEKYGK